jgi:hypothetical protein
MQIYLAGRYSRRLELCGYRDMIHDLTKHKVKAVWLNGQHQLNLEGVPIGEDGEVLIENPVVSEVADELRMRFAQDDVNDVKSCDLLIAFTEEPRSEKSGYSRGGRHVEMGIALGLRTPVWIVGPRENLFCYLPSVMRYNTIDEAVKTLSMFE